LLVREIWGDLCKLKMGRRDKVSRTALLKMDFRTNAAGISGLEVLEKSGKIGGLPLIAIDWLTTSLRAHEHFHVGNFAD
jgi:hypothetical protein